MNNRKVIVVLGMHRSGTSAITKSLELFGVSLGEKLYGASFDNPKGFWEDEECLRINQELLSINGYEYNSIIKAPDLENEKVKSLFLDAVSIVARNVERYKLWAFKDPRTCRLLEFWQSVFEKVGCEVNYIFVSRNPISVAKSLNKRNQLDLESSYFLWAQHVYMAVSTMKHRCLFLDYDDFMDNNKNNISKISNFLNVVPNNDKVSEYSTGFLSNKLRHTKFSERDVVNNSSIPNFVKSIFLPLDKVAKSGTPDYEVNKELLLNKSSVDDFNYTCRYIESLERQQNNSWLKLSEKEKLINEFRDHSDQLIQKEIELSKKHQLHVNQLENELNEVKSSGIYKFLKKIQSILSR